MYLCESLNLPFERSGHDGVEKAAQVDLGVIMVKTEELFFTQGGIMKAICMERKKKLLFNLISFVF